MTYRNPVFGPFADPMVLFTGREYLAYSTGARFPMARSTDLTSWSSAGAAFASGGAPAWSSGNPWAPSVLADEAQPGSGFFLYYGGLNSALATPANGIGVATASAAGGPFEDRGLLTLLDETLDPVRGPIGCGDKEGYSNIDPAPFIDVDGQAYLYLSTGHDAGGGWLRTMSVIPLAPDRIHAAGARRTLFGATRSWEAGVVEGPWMHLRGSTYYLFYSGGRWTDATYAMGYATSSSAVGPFEKADENPILRSTTQVNGPGGGSVIAGPRGDLWMAYHGRGCAHGPRTLRIDPLVWDDSFTPARVAVAGPTTAARPAP